METIGERIKMIRKKEQLSRRAFGEILGTSENTIVNIECERLKRPDQKESLYKLICREFGVNEKWLLTGEGKMEDSSSKDFGAICAEIGANDENAKAALLKYAELTPEDKKLFWDFVEKFLK